MNSSAPQKVVLESLAKGIPVIPDEAVGFYKQNCIVCFHNGGHRSGVRLTVWYNNTSSVFEVIWSGEVTDQLIRAYRESKRATDFAACTIALILVRELTEFTAIEQSVLGTTIDYYLVKQQSNSDLIFNHSARLEVSGILNETEDNTVEQRVSQKQKRLKKEEVLRDFIAVVEFGRPWSKMVEV